MLKKNPPPKQCSFFERPVWTEFAKNYPEKYRFEYWKTMYEYIFHRIEGSNRPLNWTDNIMYKLYSVCQYQYGQKKVVSREWIKAVAERAVSAAIYDNLPPPSIPKDLPVRNEVQEELKRMKEEMKRRGITNG